MDRERLKGNLDRLLLAVLSSGPTHAYAIISALRNRNRGTFDLPEGAVYAAQGLRPPATGPARAEPGWSA
jgi:PadR family transcriptional regulator, regulatory protein PadR